MIQLIDPMRYPGWDDLILRHPDATIFHSVAWARVLSESYGYTPAYFAAFDRGKLLALLPFMEVKSVLTGKRGVSLPFTDYCNPIMTQEVSFKDLLGRVIDFGRARKWKYIEFRGDCSEGFSQSTALSPQSFGLAPFATYLRHVVELGGNEDEVFYSFKDPTRRNIRKAAKEGIEVGIFDSLDTVEQFCRLNSLTRRDHGLPPQPSVFFERVHKHVIAKGHGFVTLASYQGRFIAGAVFFHMGRKTFYKYGASDRRYQRLRANNLVMWEAVRWCLERGMESLCLGRTEPENEGLLRFKLGWNPREEEILYYRYDSRKEAFVSSRSRVTGFHNRIFKKMPVPLLNRIGSLLYKHAG